MFGVVLVAGLVRQAEGSHQPIGVAAIDTNITGNGATAVGTTEPCAQIAAVGQSRQIDVVLKAVPAEGLAGAAFNLVYDPTKIKITAFNANIMMADGFVFLNDPLPDTDGSFRLEVVDLNVPGYASGDGALVRFTVEAVGSGSTSVYLSDSIGGDFKADFLDPQGEYYSVVMISSGQIAVGPTTCADPTPTPSPSPTIAPTPPVWNAPVKKLNDWTWYQVVNPLTVSYWNDCGNPAGSVDCRPRWATPYSQSLTDWNSRPTRIRMSHVGDGVPTADVLVVSTDLILGNPSLLGLARAYKADGFSCPSSPQLCTVRWGDAVVADPAHVGPYGTTYDRRATVSHEVGHLLSLAHESVGYQCGSDATGTIPHSVMAYDCVDPVSVGGEGENWVQDFDVCGVNQKYASATYGDAGCLDQPTQASYFHSLPPCRLLDTRTSIGKLAPPGFIQLQIAEQCGAPSMPLVSAVVLNVTVTGPTSAGFLTVYPSDSSRPLTSNLNFIAGETRPNLVTARVGVDGKVRIYNSSGQTHVVVDVFGYYGPVPSGGTRYNPLTPARIMDTRTGINGPLGKVGAGTAATLTFQVIGRGGIPLTGVDSVALNVTVTQPTAGGFLTLYPANLASRPASSNLNFVAGQTVPNLVTVKLSPDGKVKIYNSSGATHVIMDVAGWYNTGDAGQLFHAVTPARALDTRIGTGGRTGQLGANSEMFLRLSTVGGLPATGVSGVVVNATVTQPTAGSYMTLFPANEARPPTSNLNFVANQTVPNAAILKVAPDGRIKIYNLAGTTHVIVDVAGWFGP